jgi:hypothetical protein
MDYSLSNFQDVKKTAIQTLRTFLCLATAVLFTNIINAQEKPVVNKSDFFPFSVWYSGGKARATMLSEITSTSREEWKKDIQQIKSLGFNSVKTWVEWSNCEPRKGQYNFENLKMSWQRKQD